MNHSSAGVRSMGTVESRVDVSDPLVAIDPLSQLAASLSKVCLRRKFPRLALQLSFLQGDGEDLEDLFGVYDASHCSNVKSRVLRSAGVHMTQTRAAAYNELDRRSMGKDLTWIWRKVTAFEATP
ncbi:hypothetical protein RvY_01747 [Ramazzottius varieornatus]|uniref:Uncharacterized protein n=1 Tax=Ramazzottius varieornatus TaxID=947166 RepID=A0A1D1UHG9_RAMVA|nr:hypothetical protein RvY_01747 [Ramazzottius varieornatus]